MTFARTNLKFLLVGLYRFIFLRLISAPEKTTDQFGAARIAALLTVKFATLTLNA